MGDRIKGQEVEIILLVDSVQVLSLTNIKSFEMAYQLEILDEGYLGQTTNQKDMIFNGIRGSLEAHFETAKVFNLFNALVNRARRRTPGTVINIKSTLNFPNGDRPRVVIPSAAFGEAPIKFGGRNEYGVINLDYAASVANTVGVAAGF